MFSGMSRAVVAAKSSDDDSAKAAMLDRMADVCV